MDINEIISSIKHGGFSNDELNQIQDSIRFCKSQITRANTSKFNVGSAVRFVSNRTGKQVDGTVTKVARKYITVRDNADLTLWKVPANMLEEA